jgi:hypothetical protein
MKKVPVLLATLTAFAGIALPSVAVGASSSTHQSYALGKAKSCRVHYVKETLRKSERVRVKVHGKWKTETKTVRYVGCVYKATSGSALVVPTSGTAVSTTSTSVGSQRAHVDPIYTQDPTNPLMVTFTYWSSSTNGPLPDGVLSIYWGPSQQSQVLAKSTDVGVGIGDSQANALQTTIAFPAYGTEYVTTTYTSGTNSATQTDTEDIENPNPPPPTTTTLPPAPTTTTTTPYVPVVTDVTTTPATVTYGLNGGHAAQLSVTFDNGTPPLGTVTIAATSGPFSAPNSWCSYDVSSATSCTSPQNAAGHQAIVSYSGASIVTDSQGDSTDYQATSATLTVG